MHEKSQKNLQNKKIIVPLHPQLKSCSRSDNKYFAEIAQLVEHNLAKVGVASSSLVFRSKSPNKKGQSNEKPL